MPPENNAEPNYLRAALLWQYNLIAMGGAVAFSFVSGSPLPAMLAAGVELMYLATVPQMDRFKRMVRGQLYAERRKAKSNQLRNIFMQLPKELQSRYQYVATTVETIKTNNRNLSSASQMLIEPMEQRLDSLREGYLRLLHAVQLQRSHQTTTNPAAIDKEIAEIKKGMDKQPPRVQEINQRRVNILMKRLEKLQKLRENRAVLEAQVSAIEDVLELIRDQSVTMRDPEQMNAQLESLVVDLEQTEHTVEEMESIFTLVASDPMPEDPDNANRQRARS